jgi:hypothetical protein
MCTVGLSFARQYSTVLIAGVNKAHLCTLRDLYFKYINLAEIGTKEKNKAEKGKAILYWEVREVLNEVKE